MVSVYRVTALWSNFAGAPGYTKFSFSDLVDTTSRNAAGAKVQALFEGVKAYLVTGLQVAVQANIDEFDMGSGALLGSAAMTTIPTPTTGASGAAAYAGGAGFCITWNTSLILNRRRVRGRSFFVPCGNAVYDTNGTLASAAITAIGTAANTFVAATAPRPNVWSRHFVGTPPVQSGGALAAVESYTLRDMASQLRSRRL